MAFTASGSPPIRLGNGNTNKEPEMEPQLFSEEDHNYSSYNSSSETFMVRKYYARLDGSPAWLDTEKEEEPIEEKEPKDAMVVVAHGAEEGVVPTGAEEGMVGVLLGTPDWKLVRYHGTEDEMGVSEQYIPDDDDYAAISRSWRLYKMQLSC